MFEGARTGGWSGGSTQSRRGDGDDARLLIYAPDTNYGGGNTGDCRRAVPILRRKNRQLSSYHVDSVFVYLRVVLRGGAVVQRTGELAAWDGRSGRDETGGGGGTETFFVRLYARVSTARFFFPSRHRALLARLYPGQRMVYCPRKLRKIEFPPREAECVRYLLISAARRPKLTGGRNPQITALPSPRHPAPAKAENVKIKQTQTVLIYHSAPRPTERMRL